MAWLAGTNIISVGMKDEGGIGLHMNCNVNNVQEVKDIVYESLLCDLGEDQPFLVGAYHTRVVAKENVAYGAGKWRV